MLKVKDMSPAEMHALLQRESFAHLGCTNDGRPYVVPMNYAYDGKELYFFTTEGMKTQFIDANPKVCLQVEEVTDSSHWRSVMVVGEARRLTRADSARTPLPSMTRSRKWFTPSKPPTCAMSWSTENRWCATRRF